MRTQVQTGQDAETPDRAGSGADPYPPTPLYEELDIDDPPKATTGGNDPTPCNDGGG